jgi:hypothetical protein
LTKIVSPLLGEIMSTAGPRKRMRKIQVEISTSREAKS